MEKYIIFTDRKKLFKIEQYSGNFIDFTKACENKIYFKIKIPALFIYNPKMDSKWHKRFCEDLYFLYTTGVCLLDSIKIFIENSKACKNKKLTTLYKKIYDNLLLGNSLYQSLILTSYKFDDIFLSLIRLSEDAGNFGEILSNLCQYYEAQLSIKNKLKSSLSYPILLFITLILMLNLGILFFIPNYVNAFQSQLTNLPTISLYLINLCLLIKEYYSLFIIFNVFIVIFVIQVFKKSNVIGKIFFKISFLRKLCFKNYQFNIIQNLYYMFKSGMDFSSALKLMSSFKGNGYSAYAEYLYTLINNGIPFCDALKQSRIFDIEVISILKVGEESSNILLSLKNIWTTLSKQYNEFLNRAISLVEPLFILLCGILVIVFLVVFLIPLISYENFNYIWEGL